MWNDTIGFIFSTACRGIKELKSLLMEVLPLCPAVYAESLPQGQDTFEELAKGLQKRKTFSVPSACIYKGHIVVLSFFYLKSVKNQSRGQPSESFNVLLLYLPVVAEPNHFCLMGNRDFVLGGRRVYSTCTVASMKHSLQTHNSEIT